MEKAKYRLIISKGTAQVLRVDKLLKAAGIATDFVPTPPETGTVCAIAIKFEAADLEKVEETLAQHDIAVAAILEEKPLKLQGLIDQKLAQRVSDPFLQILRKIEAGEDLHHAEITYLLTTEKEKEIEMIRVTADMIRKEMVGDVVEVRGAVEFSNYCVKSCHYCGINACNPTVGRYRMTEDEIMEVVHRLHDIGIRTVVLQSGEDPLWSTERLAALCRRIKAETNMGITLSAGEKTREEYALLKEAGANNYLLKIEAINRALFEAVHPDDAYDVRLQCTRWLKELGFLLGSGNIIGLPNQRLEDIAADILHFKEMGIHMIGIGPFIPAKGTQFEALPHGRVDLTLRTVAVTRIVCKKVFIPSTTALASLDEDAQVWALHWGANSIMLVNTPPQYRGNYRIYDNKNMVDMDAAIYAIQKAGRQFPKYLKMEAIREFDISKGIEPIQES